MGVDGSIDVPISEHPGLIVMPKLALPGILRGLTPADSEAGWFLGHQFIWAAPREELVKAPGGVHCEIKMNPMLVCRLIAKTAYCLYVWEEPAMAARAAPIRDFILGRADALGPYLVGCLDGPLPDSAGPHNLGVLNLEMNGTTFLVGVVQLFARHNAPRYVAVM